MADRSTEARPERASLSMAREAGRTLAIAGATGAIIGAVLLLWQVSQVVLVVFAAALFAIFLDGLTMLLRRALKLPRPAALALVALLLVGGLLSFIWLAGPSAGEQVTQLSERVPGSVAKLRDMLAAQDWGRIVLANTPPPRSLVPSSADLLGRISGVFSSALGAIVNIGLILVIGAYLAIAPAVYLRGLLLLVPAPACSRVEGIVQALVHALRWWLLGRVAAMLAVGVLTGLGLWAIGMPLALVLAIIAGALSFIPFVGPALSVLPALLVALAETPLMALWVLLLYIAVQFVEGNFITPLLAERTVSLPPATLLTSQLLLGVLFGFFGLLLATPLAVVLMVLVQAIYVRGILGHRVLLLGEHDA